MLENENLVTDVTENVEIPTEETQVEVPAEKTYTQSQLDEIVGKRLARNFAKIRKEYDKEYGGLMDILKVMMNYLIISLILLPIQMPFV